MSLPQSKYSEAIVHKLERKARRKEGKRQIGREVKGKEGKRERQKVNWKKNKRFKRDGEETKLSEWVKN